MHSTQDEILKVYEQLCMSYRAIDDFRAKLLGFLPLVSGSGVFLLLNNAFTNSTNSEKSQFAHQFLTPIGYFGFVVTLGLFFYEIYGIRKCHALIEAGKQLEYLLGIHDGQFRKRPRSVLYLINEPFAASVIYPAVLAAWLFLASVFRKPLDDLSVASEAALAFAIQVFIVVFAFTLLYSLVLAYGQSVYNILVRKKADPSGEFN